MILLILRWFFVCFHFLNEGEKAGRTSSQLKSCVRKYSGPSISTDSASMDSASMGSINFGLKMFLKCYFIADMYCVDRSTKVVSILNMYIFFLVIS